MDDVVLMCQGLGGWGKASGDCLECFCHAVLVVAFRHEIGCCAHFGSCIGHGNAHAGEAEHGEVIVSVTEGDEVRRVELQDGEETLERERLVDALRHEFDEERCGTEEVHAVAHEFEQFGLGVYHVGRVTRHQQLGGLGGE